MRHHFIAVPAALVLGYTFFGSPAEIYNYFTKPLRQCLDSMELTARVVPNANPLTILQSCTSFGAMPVPQSIPRPPALPGASQGG